MKDTMQKVAVLVVTCISAIAELVDIFGDDSNGGDQ